MIGEVLLKKNCVTKEIKFDIFQVKPVWRSNSSSDIKDENVRLVFS